MTIAAATIGIDPGVTGGIVVLADQLPVTACRTPILPGAGRKQYDVPGMARLLESALRDFKTVRAGIEKVGAMPRDGRVGAFTFGRGYGLWLGLMAGLGVSYTEIQPQRWQSRMLAGLPKGPHTKVSAMQRCQALFPEIELRAKADSGIADAALIAEYLRQMNNGKAT
jgi:crossover junction endodeoxyribonuclease RuvC